MHAGHAQPLVRHVPYLRESQRTHSSSGCECVEGDDRTLTRNSSELESEWDEDARAWTGTYLSDGRHGATAERNRCVDNFLCQTHEKMWGGYGVIGSTVIRLLTRVLARGTSC